LRDFTADSSAWADFLISKAALILASIILFAAVFHLAAEFKDFETQKQLDYLAWDFKKAVDRVGAGNFQEEYCFNEKEVFRALPSGENVKISVSGEYITLEVESDKRNFRAVRPFAFRILPFNESVLQEILLTRFGTEGSTKSPLTADYSEIKAFIQVLGTEEAVINPEENISLKKELIYIRDEEGVSAFAYILIYQ
jgi:hypothetical protein